MAIDINSLIKQYANPWDTSYSYLDPTGAVLGKGYDSYADAIRKLAFTSGAKQYEATPGIVDYERYNHEVPAQAGGWGYSPLYTPEFDDGGSYTPENRGQLFGTQQELYDYLLAQPGSPLTYDSREKYGRALTDGQMQNMYALLSSPNAKAMLEAYKGVPDWDYHRGGYEPAYNPIAGMMVSGDNALVGSTPIFGADGKITGYKITNPEHLNSADTSGRVQGSVHGDTQYNKDLASYATPMGDGSFFIKASDVDKFGYKSIGSASYEKAPTMASKLGEMFTKAFIGAVAGGAAGFGPLSPEGWAAKLGTAGTTATGATGGSMFGDIGDWFSNLFNSGGSGASQFASSIAGSADPIEAMYQTMAATGTTSVTDAAAALGFGSANAMLGAINPEWLSAGTSFLSQAASEAVKKLASSGTSGLLSGGLQAVGGYLAGNAAQDASKTAAQAQIEAARIAADAAKFKPVGVTTRFGKSQFTKDAQGNVVSAGYNVSPDIKAMQDSLIGIAPGMLSQFTGSQAATAPMGVGAQRAMSLGNQYLNTDPMAQAKKYYDDQQAIMATGRARDQAGALTGEFNRGTYGLATGATGMMGAANPRLEAMYNAQRQQDLQASANATQGGMDYAKFGAGLVGTGGNMLRDMYGTQTAAYSPFATAMTGAQNIEGLGQNALDMSINIGKTASPAQAGSLLGQGMLGAAQTMQQANQYSPWGTALMNAGNALNTMQNQTQQQQQQQQFLQALLGRSATPV